MKSVAATVTERLRPITSAFDALLLPTMRKAVTMPTHIPARPMMGGLWAYRRSAPRVSAESFIRTRRGSSGFHTDESHDANGRMFRQRTKRKTPERASIRRNWIFQMREQPSQSIPAAELGFSLFEGVHRQSCTVESRRGHRGYRPISIAKRRVCAPRTISA